MSRSKKKLPQQVKNLKAGAAGMAKATAGRARVFNKKTPRDNADEEIKEALEDLKKNVVEKNGRFVCSDCGYEWSATLGDDEVPEHHDCENS